MLAGLPKQLRVSGAIEVRKKLGTISGGNILDVGTWDGDFIHTLMKTLKDYTSFTGIDISDDELKKARERFKNASVNFMEMNAETMTFQENRFDTVCASYTIHHLENIDTVLAEMYRVLKPGGYFIIQELYSDGAQTAAQLVDLDVHHLDVKADSLLGIPHFKALTRQKLRDLVNKVGLNDVEVFESSWSVKCLFCDDVQKCTDPMRIDNIERALKRIDDSLVRVCEHPSYNELKEESEILKERVRSDGSAAASVMYFFGRK